MPIYSSFELNDVLKRTIAMRKIILVVLCLLVFKISNSNNLNESNNSLLVNNNTNTELNLTNNYQQFKFQVVNFGTENHIDYGSLKKRRRRRSGDTFILYVAGGTAVATATLILVNDPDNFTNNNSSSVTMGIALGGTVASGLFVTKYFVDKNKRR